MSEPGKNPKLTPEEQRERLARLLKEKAAGPRRGPLSVGQQALWFLYKLAPESAAYHVPFVARVRSAVDVDALRRALVRVVDRHPILRTTYRAADGAPEQHVHPEASAVASFEAVDASSLSWPELTRRASAEAHEPFDLERGPAMRAHLYSRAHDDHLLLVLAHHIALDFWSLLVVVDELGALYAEEAGGPKAALKPLRSSYFDFVRREAEMLAGPEGERMLAYWRERLGDGPAPLQIPTDRPRPAMPSFQGAARPFAVDAATSERLRKVARDEGTTLNNVLLAAFFVLLHRSSGQDDVTVGMPTGGRGGADTADVAGYFVNPVALRCDLAHNPSFRDLLGRVKAAVLGGVANRDYPLPLLVEKLGLPRDPGRSPLFQAVFILQQPQRSDGAAALLLGGPGARARLGGLALESVDLEQHVAQFDLELMLIAHEGALAGTLQYDTALFDASTVDALCARFANLLGGVADDPARPIGELPFLEAAERRALLVEYNDTAVDFGPARASLLHQGFEASADRAPEALAAVGADGRLGYGELERQANRLAHHLRAQGVGRGSLVGVCVERSTAMVVAVLAVLKAGGAYVPLDPAYPQDRLAHILTHAGAATVVTEA
ncbi:MAG TPA: condensation domain-containing protein, partial [Polyangiaceae bacterium]|nr:condensation domain-containing protein [Polyangiaceae bacterium]